ncbi:non-ribosomal peptide synthetase [Microbispora tritici]|uniref:Non-ribosomal peptide synthetase n=3 Tax=Streptosporangiaceae TaxID=2004 RepID=A0ABY3LNN7_9ACTN|nr:amino acid adenylation domain-containing protein [Microbispora fusca]TYB42141.1 non-ribosomal peptide synthetase [Microbispora tritici]
MMERSDGGAMQDPSPDWRDATITDLLDEQVRRRPDAVALRFDGQDMTYMDLDRRAELLARHLRDLGVRTEAAVGVFFERSFEMVIALVAILKAGGAYVPLHQNEPPDRFRYMLEQAGCRVVLTHDALVDRIPKIDGTVVNLDHEPATTPGAEPVDGAISPDNLAYICYTSGSTGMPKGVAVRHRGVVRLVQDGDYASLTENETFLQLCSLRFDPSAFEIWGALLNGARLVVYRPGTPALHELADFLEAERITTLWMTTGLLHRMVDGYLDRLGGLRQFLGGGEALSPVLINRLHRTYPDLLVVNGYGPTEDTCFTSCHVVSEEVGDTVPIGRAVTDTRLYVLDERLRPVPDGEWGLLYTSGSGLARGYVGRPGLTAERFVADPFVPGERMYAIGDLVRRVEGGVLEFRGRLDDQVKVDGYRIELGEIQAVLAGQPEVNEAVVVVREGLTPGRKILVAFVVPVSGTEGLVPKLRVALHRKLPRYMHPAAIIEMEALPETLGNKIDRKSLPALEQLPRDVDADYEAPRTPLEALLADLLTDALAVQDIGVHDDFFELGGSSLVAMDLLAHVREVFNADVPAGEFFAGATVAGLAELIGEFAPHADAAEPQSWMSAKSGSVR